MLLQPEPGRTARELRTASEWADFHPAENIDRVLLGWPLPGAHGGRHVFELYLRVPAADGVYSVKRPAGDSAAVTGLFYQNTGRAAGRTPVVDGAVTLIGRRNDTARWREGRFDLTCRDGTRLIGTFRARRSRMTLTRFEEQHAADISDLLVPSGGSDPPAPDAR